MYLMCYEIKIGAYTLKGLESVIIESGVNQLSDLCTIALPGQVRGQAYRLEDKIKRGDPITVRLGYDNQLRDEFKGYVRSIHPNSPLKLECEDSIYLFRKPIKDKQFKKTTATVVARYIVDQINSQLPANQKMKLITDAKGFQFDKFTIIHANGYKALEELKSQTGLAIYCRGRELHVHLKYTEKQGDVTYDFARNVEESDGLEYVKAEDIRLRVKVIGRTKKGAKVEVEAGDKGGDLRTFQRPNVSSVATLNKIASEELKNLCFDGYKGAIAGWLIPYVTTGYTARIVDKDYPERAGSYYVQSVKTEFSANGGKRSVGLGVKIVTPAPPKTGTTGGAGTPDTPIKAAYDAPVEEMIAEDEGDHPANPNQAWA